MRGNVGRCRWLAASLMALLALGALVAALMWQKIFDSVLAAQLALSPGSRSYKEWVETSVPLHFDIYLFNWTNSERFPEEVPHLMQLGPYSFREDRRRYNVTWHPQNDSVSYRTFRSYQFDEFSSNGSMDDTVVMLNPIAASAVFRSRYSSMKIFLPMALATTGQELTLNKSARELLFDGYEDLMLDFAKALPASVTGDAPKIDRFGWFYERNNSLDSDGYMEVSTGTASGLPGQILKWNYKDHLPFYEGQCSQLFGSVGEFLPRNLTEDSHLTMFIADLCRTVHMHYTYSGALDGLQYHRYAVSEESFDRGCKSNECFCNGPCEWGGVMNVSACRFGAPIFITLPHFLHGDERLAQMVTGLNPDEEKHSFYFSVEPKLGIPLDVAARFQLNIYLEPYDNVAMYENVPRMLFPILWVEQRVTVDEQVTSELKFVRNILDWGAIFCAGVALFFAALVGLTTCTNICLRKPKYVPPTEIMFEKPKDEAELKLYPL